MDLDRYVAVGEVMPQSYVHLPAERRAHQRIKYGTDLAIHLLTELRRYDREATAVLDDAPWLSAAAATIGSDLFQNGRYIGNRFMRGGL